LAPKSGASQIGRESGTIKANGISVLKTSQAAQGYEGHRLVYAEGGKIVGAMRVMKAPSSVHHVVANTFVDPQHRRQGIATKLDEAATKLFGTLDRSRYESEAGKAFVASLGGAAPTRARPDGVRP
jgi:predicted GNAT family acetyltransferase